MARLSITNAARVTGVSRVTLHRHIKAGKLRQQPDGTVDTTDLTHAGFVLQLETISERNTESARVVPPVTPATPVTPRPLIPEIDYRERYIARLEQDVDRLQQELDALREEAAKKDQLLQEYHQQVLQMLQEQRHLLQPVQQVQQRRLPAGDPHAMRQRIIALLAEHPEGLHHAQVAQALGVESTLGPTLRAMLRDGLVRRLGVGAYAEAENAPAAE
jgi:small-conductance mechanosensitive channel